VRCNETIPDDELLLSWNQSTQFNQDRELTYPTLGKGTSSSAKVPAGRGFWLVFQEGKFSGSKFRCIKSGIFHESLAFEEVYIRPLRLLLQGWDLRDFQIPDVSMNRR